MGAARRAPHDEVHSGKPKYDRSQHARRGLGHGGELRLWCCQARRPEHRGHQCRALFRPALGTQGSAIRLGQVRMDRQHHPVEFPALHVGGGSIQKHPRRSQCKYSAECGSTGTGNTGYYLPKLLEETIGTKFNIVVGYQGGADIDLAAEKGEVHCRAFTTTVFFAREPFHTWRKNGLVRVLVQAGKKREERLPDVPTFNELMDQYQTSDSIRRLAA